jgi:hypothetical protein
LKIIGYNNQGENIPKNHNWNLKYYKIINWYAPFLIFMTSSHKIALI